MSIFPDSKYYSLSFFWFFFSFYFSLTISNPDLYQPCKNFNTSYLPPDLNDIFLRQSAEVRLCGASEDGTGAWTLSVLLPSSSLLLLPLELGDWLLLWLLSLPLSLPLEWSGLGSWSRYASKEKNSTVTLHRKVNNKTILVSLFESKFQGNVF